YPQAVRNGGARHAWRDGINRVGSEDPFLFVIACVLPRLTSPKSSLPIRRVHQIADRFLGSQSKTSGQKHLAGLPTNRLAHQPQPDERAAKRLPPESRWRSGWRKLATTFPWFCRDDFRKQSSGRRSVRTQFRTELRGQCDSCR